MTPNHPFRGLSGDLIGTRASDGLTPMKPATTPVRSGMGTRWPARTGSLHIFAMPPTSGGEVGPRLALNA
jgi:hypothetical protein